MPAHSSREIVILMGSLTTCDPTDINETIEEAKKLGLRCSVIGLAAEVYVCRQLTKITGTLTADRVDESLWLSPINFVSRF